MASKKSSGVEVSKAPSGPPGTRINFMPSGATGLQRSYGYIYEEFLPELQGKHAIKIWKEMENNDPVIGAMLFAIDMFMRRVGWFVEPVGEDDKSVADAQFLRECKEDMDQPWPELISEINSMLPYGWSWHEILYKQRDSSIIDDEGNAQSKFSDGRIGWSKFEIRSQDSLERWDFDESGKVRGLWQRPAPTYQELYVPMAKSLLFRTTSRKNNPEGRSVLRNAYRPWYFKKRIEEIEGIGVERDLAGLPFAEVPAEMLREDASDDDKAALASIVELLKNVRRDQQEGVVWPQSVDVNGNKLYEFKLLNSGGTRQFSTDQIITRYEQRIAMTVLADIILLGNDSTGSFALSTSKAGMFQSVLTSWLDMIADVINKVAIPRLFRANNMPGPYPEFRHEEVQHPSLADLATFVAALAGAGAQLFPDTDLENHFRKIAQLPLRESKPEEVKTEDDLRTQQLSTQLQIQQTEEKQAKKGILPGAGGAGGPSQTLGKQPGSVPGAPTKTTGPVKSKLPPQQRRATAAVSAANNTQVNKSLPKTEKCKYCKDRATKRTLWAEGMAYIPTCDNHMGKARHRIEVNNKDEVVGVRPIKKRVVVRRAK